MPRRLNRLLVVGSIAFLPSQAFAQTSGSASIQSTNPPAAVRAEASGLTTPTGQEVHFSLAGYEYVEPGDTSISIHGPKFGGGYRATTLINSGKHVFLQAGAQGLFGAATYDGWCSPFLITPEPMSPNGYALDLGDPAPCSESGDKDWYVEGRVLLGRDFIGRTWGWSPEIGLGIRHLSNGATGVSGYRTDDYLYLPIGVTARTIAASHHALSFNMEYDHLLRGWQRTHDSQLGGGDVPATPIAPPFTIEGFSDISFDQHSGWALRAGAKYQMTRHWTVAPEYIHWNVGASPVNYETATFTVNSITARQQVGAYEPLNRTNELTVELGFRF